MPNRILSPIMQRGGTPDSHSFLLMLKIYLIIAKLRWLTLINEFFPEKILLLFL